MTNKAATISAAVPANVKAEAAAVAVAHGMSPVALGLRAVIYVVARRHEIMIDPVQISTWRAWAKRNGRTEADKGDEADAMWIRDYWLAVRAPQVEVA